MKGYLIFRWARRLACIVVSVMLTTFGCLQIAGGVAAAPPHLAAATHLAASPGDPPTVTCDSNPNIFNTGYDASTGGVLPDGSDDANWEVAGGFPGFSFPTGTDPADLAQLPPADATFAPALVGNVAPFAWAASPYGNANWITAEPESINADTGQPQNQEGVSPDPTSYNSLADWYYRYQFNLDPSVVPATFSLLINWLADNSVAGVWVNGIPQSGTNLPQFPTDPYQYQGYLGENASQTLLTSDWQSGLNTIIVQIKSGWTFQGFDAQVAPQALCPTLTVSKTVVDRLDPADQFTVSAQNTDATVLASATTSGNGDFASSSPAFVTTGDTYYITDSMAQGSVSSLSAYGITIDCTDTTTGDTVIPQGSAPVWTLVIANPHAYSCNVTNGRPGPFATTKTLATVNGAPATSSTQVGPGDQLVYHITVADSGLPGTVTLTDTVPDHTTYTGSGEGWSCPTGSPATARCTQSVTVPGGQAVTVAFTVTVDDPLEAGVLAVANEVSSSEGTCTCTVTTPTIPALETSKTLLTVNGQPAPPEPQIAPGDVLVYQVTVANTGGSPGATTLTETVPDHTTYTGSGEGWSCPTGSPATATCTQSVTVPAATARSPGSVAVPFTVTVADPLPAGTTDIANEVTSSEGTCPECTVTTPTVAALATTKTLATINGASATASTPVGPGDQLGYHITVANTGGSDGTTTLTEAVPDNTTYTGTGEGWSCATGSLAGTICTQDVTVAAGATLPPLSFTVTVDNPLATGTTEITNTVTSSVGTCTAPDTPACTVTNPTTAILDAVKTLAEVDGSPAAAGAEVGPGQVLLYHLAVTNSGGLPGTTILTETIPTGTTYTGTGQGWTCSPDTSPPSTCTQAVTAAAGATVTVDFTVTVDSPLAVGITNITNAVTSSTGTCSACTVTNPTEPAVLDAVKTLAEVNGHPAAAGMEVGPGDVLLYHLAVTNSGGTADTTTLTETIPTGTTYTGTGQGWTCSPDTSPPSTCTQAVTAAAGATVTVDFTVTVDNPLAAAVDDIINTVTSSTGICSACTVTNPTEPAVLDAVKTLAEADGSPGTAGAEVGPGQVLLYHIAVTNSGGRPGTTTLTEIIPTGTTYTGGTFEGWTCSPSLMPPSTCTQAVTAAAGATVTVDFTVTVDIPLAAGTDGITNAVTSSNGTCSDCTVTNPTTPPAPDPVKTLAEVNGNPATAGMEVGPGEVLLYHIAVTNAGGRAGTTTLTEAIPTGTTYTGSGQGWTCSPDTSPPSTCTQKVTVLGGASVTVDFTVTVDSPLAAGITEIKNVVTSSTGTCSDCTATNPVRPAFLDAEKTLAEVNGSPTTTERVVGPGDVLLYHVTVTNAGGQEGTTTLTETIPTGTTYTGTGQGWTCSPDMSPPSTCTQKVSVLGGAAVTVDFTATVDNPLAAGTTEIKNVITSSAGDCGSCKVTNPAAPAPVPPPSPIIPHTVAVTG